MCSISKVMEGPERWWPFSFDPSGSEWWPEIKWQCIRTDTATLCGSHCAMGIVFGIDCPNIRCPHNGTCTLASETLECMCRYSSKVHDRICHSIDPWAHPYIPFVWYTETLTCIRMHMSIGPVRFGIHDGSDPIRMHQFDFADQSIRTQANRWSKANSGISVNSLH